MGNTILVTGGAGYIGSHTVVELLDAGHDVVVIDDLRNSSVRSLDAVTAICGRSATFVEADVANTAALDVIFTTHRIDAVIHFAGLKAVGESVENPLLYWRTNVGSSIALVDAMVRHGVFDLVFSSSCTVYGDPETVPITEDSPLGAVSPYGRTKLTIEQMLADVAAADDRFRIMLLRYFNPVGAHPSGTIGEDPTGIPNNLMPFITQVAVGLREKLSVFGDDYDTPDGTCIRDYIHVVDLARGHLAALANLESGCRPINLGTGVGSSVMEVIDAASAAVGKPIAYEVVDRRAGDAAAVYADPALAAGELGWTAERTLADMCADHWRWQSQNPRGYEG